MLRTIIIFFAAAAIVLLGVYSWNAVRSNNMGNSDGSATDWQGMSKPGLTEYSKSLKGADDNDFVINVTSTSMSATDKTKIPAPQKPVIDINKNYGAVLHTTAGDITMVFNTKETPNTVNNFVYLAEQKFYDNTIFHRVIKGFMIQGGDPLGTGSGGPGYRFDDEKFSGEYSRGTVAMANAGANTNGSQFFIMHAKQNLPKNYTIFGTVVKGLEVVDKIASAPVETSSSGEQSKPVTPVKVMSVDVIEE